MIKYSIESVDPHEGTMIAKATLGDKSFRLNVFVPIRTDGEFIRDDGEFYDHMRKTFAVEAEKFFYGDKYKNHLEMEAPNLCKRKWSPDMRIKVAVESVDAHHGVMLVSVTDGKTERKFTIPVPREPNGHVVRDESDFRRQVERTIIPEFIRVVNGDPRKREIEALSGEILKRKWSTNA